MPDAARAVSGIPRADPGGRVTPRFWHRLNRFRHFCGGSLALASLDLACRNLVPAFPQRSPPRLLTAAACGGLRSAPDCRPRRALLHLSYSCAAPVLLAMLVTHDPKHGPGGKAHTPSGPPHSRNKASRSGRLAFGSFVEPPPARYRSRPDIEFHHRGPDRLSPMRACSSPCQSRQTLRYTAPWSALRASGLARSARATLVLLLHVRAGRRPPPRT